MPVVVMMMGWLPWPVAMAGARPVDLSMCGFVDGEVHGGNPGPLHAVDLEPMVHAQTAERIEERRLR
jgi:hypothetical protein